ncbi:MAG: TIGR04563 family protein [Myxococcales bacterium]|nr:TIGR04563 family protein [Myxococcales bacterium]
MAAKVKMTLYLPEDLLEQAQEEAERQDRSVSWLMQQAWRLSYERLQDYPSIEQLNAVS